MERKYNTLDKFISLAPLSSIAELSVHDLQENFQVLSEIEKYSSFFKEYSFSENGISDLLVEQIATCAKEGRLLIGGQNEFAYISQKSSDRENVLKTCTPDEFRLMNDVVGDYVAINMNKAVQKNYR